MKDLYIVANWKENKSLREASEWVSAFTISELDLESKQVVICSSFTLLGFLKSKILAQNLPFKIGAQDVSSFEEGPYTGETSARQVKDYADFVIIGHSERRKNFNEDDNLLAKKVSLSVSQGISPIFCVSDLDMIIPQEVKIVAYEPIAAIGTGNPDSPEDADSIAKKIKDSNENVTHVLYGGSVTSENVTSFTKMENIDGVLVGGESLDPLEFLKIVKNAQ
jgi:triosephosphate isomerase